MCHGSGSLCGLQLGSSLNLSARMIQMEFDGRMYEGFVAQYCDLDRNIWWFLITGYKDALPTWVWEIQYCLVCVFVNVDASNNF